MKTILVAIFLFSNLSALAAPRLYEIKMDLSFNGKKASSPRIIVSEGETGMVTQENSDGKTFVEVTAREGSVQNRQGILMSFVVGAIDKNGNKTILSKPQILAKENQMARFTSGSKDGNEEMSLSVLVNSKTN